MDHEETQGSAKNLIMLLKMMGRGSEATQLASRYQCTEDSDSETESSESETE